MQRMLDYLKDKKDVGFFLSVQTLMQTCRSVVDLKMAFFCVRLFNFPFNCTRLLSSKANSIDKVCCFFFCCKLTVFLMFLVFWT